MVSKKKTRRKIKMRRKIKTHRRKNDCLKSCVKKPIQEMYY